MRHQQHEHPCTLSLRAMSISRRLLRAPLFFLSRTRKHSPSLDSSLAPPHCLIPSQLGMPSDTAPQHDGNADTADHERRSRHECEDVRLTMSAGRSGFAAHRELVLIRRSRGEAHAEVTEPRLKTASERPIYEARRIEAQEHGRMRRQTSVARESATVEREPKSLPIGSEGIERAT